MATESTHESQITLPASPEAFYATGDWGAKSGQTLEEFSFMWGWAAENHGDRKARNMTHAIGVMFSTNQHADGYELSHPNDEPINRKLLNAMAICHDIAGLDEKTAAAMFVKAGSTFGYDDDETAQVSHGILSTDELVEPSTREEMLLTMGDMDNLAEPDYSKVKQRSQQFEAEARDTEGNRFDWVGYHRKNLGRVTNFVMKAISLGGYEKDWQNKVHITARQMIRDFAMERGLPVPECVQEIGGTAIELFSEEAAQQE